MKIPTRWESIYHKNYETNNHMPDNIELKHLDVNDEGENNVPKNEKKIELVFYCRAWY